MVVSDKKRGLAPDRIWLFGPIENAKLCLTSADVVPFLPSTPAPLLFSPDKLLHLSAGSFITICNWDISIVATGILRNRPVIESIYAPPEPVQHRALCIYECPN